LIAYRRALYTGGKLIVRLKLISQQHFCIYDEQDKLILDVEFGERIWPLANGDKLELASDIVDAVQRLINKIEKPQQMALIK